MVSLLYVVKGHWSLMREGGRAQQNLEQMDLCCSGHQLCVSVFLLFCVSEHICYSLHASAWEFAVMHTSSSVTATPCKISKFHMQCVQICSLLQSESELNGLNG